MVRRVLEENIVVGVGWRVGWLGIVTWEVI